MDRRSKTHGAGKRKGPPGVHEAQGGSTIATEAEIHLVESIETIKAGVRAAARTLALLAHSPSGPFAHQIAFEAATLTAMLDAAEPGWKAQPQWATTRTALEYFSGFRATAQQLGEALQATSHP